MIEKKRKLIELRYKFEIINVWTEGVIVIIKQIIGIEKDSLEIGKI